MTLTSGTFTVVMPFPDSGLARLHKHFDDLLGGSSEVKDQSGGWQGDVESSRYVWSAESARSGSFLSECIAEDEARNWNVTLDDLQSSINKVRIETIQSRHLPFVILLVKCSVSSDAVREGNELQDLFRISVPVRNHVDELARHYSWTAVPGASALYSMHLPVEKMEPLISTLSTLQGSPIDQRDSVIGPLLPEGIREASSILSSHFVLASNHYLVVCNAETHRPGSLLSPAFIYVGEHNPISEHDWPVSLQIPKTPSRFGLPTGGPELLLATTIWLNERNQELSHTLPLEAEQESSWWIPSTRFHERRVEELGSLSQEISSWTKDLTLVHRLTHEAVISLAEHQYQDCEEVMVAGEVPLQWLPPSAQDGYLSYWANTIRDELDWQDADLSQRRHLVDVELSSHETLASLRSTRAIRILTIVLAVLTGLSIALTWLQI